MKRLYFTFIAILSFLMVSWGNNELPVQNKPKVGDILVINKNKGEKYNHIDFPRLNFLVKRGSIASYKSVHNLEVIVTEVLENKYGRIDVKLERADGKKFFNHKNSVLANYEKALSSGELYVKS